MSEDGNYYWDGDRWTPTLSPDGRWRWNGSEWKASAAGPATLASRPEERVATSWTRPMHYLVAALFAVQAIFLGSMPFWYIQTMTQWADAMNKQNQQLNQGSPSLPPDLAANLNNEMTVAFYLAIFVLVAICVLALAGALSRFMWAFYVILGLLCLETLYLGLGAGESIVTSLVSSAFLGQSIGPPAWMIWAEVGFAIPAAALFVWMVIAMIRTGPWAMRKAGAAEPAAVGMVQPA